MKFPCLVLSQYCTTDIILELEPEGVQENGEPFEAVHYTGKCNYQDSAKTVLTAEKKLVEITGTALFPGDVCPELPVISGGTATVFGIKRRIQKGKKVRNPDGSVNFTEVMMI